jgi:hypothetical protein
VVIQILHHLGRDAFREDFACTQADAAGSGAAGSGVLNQRSG